MSAGLLAAAEAWLVPVLAALTLANTALGIVVGIRQIFFDRAARRMDTMEAEVKHSASALIDSKFAIIIARIDNIDRRLGRGDEDFDHLSDRDLELERKLMARMEGLKEYIHANCASKDDLKELNRRFDAMQQAVARSIVERTERGAEGRKHGV